MKKIVSALGLGLALTFGGAAMAEGDRGFERSQGDSHGGGHHMMKRMFSKLGLTEQQQEEVKAIREAAHASMKDNKGQFEGFRDQMKALVQAESFDEAAYRTLIESKQSHKVDMMVIKAKMKNGVWNVLTAEQQAEMAEMIEKRGERGQRHQRRGHRG
jgi:protein CpxP